ncbi:uncharacterized, partial [Tachysurus ichikawai]
MSRRRRMMMMWRRIVASRPSSLGARQLYARGMAALLCAHTGHESIPHALQTQLAARYCTTDCRERERERLSGVGKCAVLSQERVGGGQAWSLAPRGSVMTINSQL